MKKPQSLRFGISLYVRDANQSLWENGIFQNCLFLAMLLERSPLTGSVCFVLGGGGGATPEDAQTFLQDSPYPIIDMAAAQKNLDVMIEMSAQLDINWMIPFKEKGGKIIAMRVGNDYVIDIERMVFDKPSALVITGAPYDEIWTIPEYENTCVPYYRSAMRAPVRMMPHLWNPLILNRACQALPDDISFEYKPGRKRWRAGIFEPNVCMVKTGLVPLLICENAHRSDTDLFEHIYACNTYHLIEKPLIASVAKSLDIDCHNLVSYEGRYPIWDVVSRHCDVIVCHQWENAQNYLYYEALYGGYPLIHNSHLIAGCGYRYRDFDCEEGARALLRAFLTHDDTLDEYRQTARAFLNTLDPGNTDNIRSYTDAVAALYRHP